MNDEHIENFMKEVENKYARGAIKDMMDGMLNLFCASGNKRAKVMKTYVDIRAMIQEQIEKTFMTNLDNEEKVNEFYNLMIAIKEQTKQLIQDFKEKNI